MKFLIKHEGELAKRREDEKKKKEARAKMSEQEKALERVR